MAKYIDADLAKQAIDAGNVHRGIISAMQSLIDDVPAADVEEVKHGEWISVKERLPEEDGEYLVCFRYDVPDFDSKPHFDVLDFNEKGKFFEISGSGWFQSYGIYGIITHWKPIEPPEVEK